MLTAIDMFAGWGGSTSGWDAVPGIQPVLAINHNPIAVAAHEQNFPHIAHDCADLSTVDPRRYPRTDIAWASPSCTAHSSAQGRKRTQPDLFTRPSPEDEEAERSRATMWNVIEFAEHHGFRYVVTENVAEARTRWRMWPAWLHAWDCIDYDVKVVYLNSMFANQLGDAVAQDRNRMYVMAWKRGECPPDLDKWTRPVATCGECGHTGRAVQAWKDPRRPYGKYGRTGQYWWRCAKAGCHDVVHPTVPAASTVLDLNNLGAPIGDRLKSTTRAKIRREIGRHPGADRLVFDYNGAARLLSEPLPTQTTVEGNALLTPSVDPGDIESALFRMFDPEEVKDTMGFPAGYRLLGSREQRFAGLGAAVTPCVARDLGAAVVEAASGGSGAAA